MRLCGTLTRFGPPRAEWLLEVLDSKHADVRALGWTWLHETPLRDEPNIWHKLLESPYDDIKGPLVAELTERSRGADFDTVRLLWASVLLNMTPSGASTALFTTQQTFAAGMNPRAMALGDVNGDGKPDLIVANQNDQTVSVLLNMTPPGASLPMWSR